MYFLQKKLFAWRFSSSESWSHDPFSKVDAFFLFPLGGLTPLAGVAAMASPDTVRAMLDAACDPNPQPCGVGHGASDEG